MPISKGICNTAKDKTRFASSPRSQIKLARPRAIAHTLTSLSLIHLSERPRTLHECHHRFHLQTRTSFQQFLVEEIRRERSEAREAFNWHVQRLGSGAGGGYEQCVGGANCVPNCACAITNSAIDRSEQSLLQQANPYFLTVPMNSSKRLRLLWEVLYIIQ